MSITGKNRFFLVLIWLLVAAGACFLHATSAAQKKDKSQPKKMRVGYSIALAKINEQSMQYAKSLGVSCIEVSGISALIGKDRQLKYSDQQIRDMATQAKAAAKAAGIEIWSIHMAYSRQMDLSTISDTAWQRILEVHSKILQEVVSILQPKIVLFHPSWYLGLHERPMRIRQLVKSCKYLNPKIRSLGATMVIENMLGFELQKSPIYERPLCRTVEETVAIMAKLPSTVGSAIDMNHIKNPEKLIMAMGKRLKTVHIADGNGKEENHYLPCNHKGQNDWNAILNALYAVHYRGPFLFECHYTDVRQLTDCYDELYRNYLSSIHK